MMYNRNSKIDDSKILYTLIRSWEFENERDFLAYKSDSKDCEFLDWLLRKGEISQEKFNSLNPIEDNIFEDWDNETGLLNHTNGFGDYWYKLRMLVSEYAMVNNEYFEIIIDE